MVEKENPLMNKSLQSWNQKSSIFNLFVCWKISLLGSRKFLGLKKKELSPCFLSLNGFIYKNIQILGLLGLPFGLKSLIFILFRRLTRPVTRTQNAHITARVVFCPNSPEISFSTWHGLWHGRVTVHVTSNLHYSSSFRGLNPVFETMNLSMISNHDYSWNFSSNGLVFR